MRRFLKLAVWIWLISSPAAADEAVSFRNDVMAVLSKAGCNAGKCHGNQSGKGGFRLSLRGENPQRDFESITRQHGGRRINRMHPAASLILAKATGRVAHEGGVRFARESLPASMLTRWVRNGAPTIADGDPRLVGLQVHPEEKVVRDPEDEVQLAVTATFSDGSQRDVTALAVYETSGIGADVSSSGLVKRGRFGQVTVVARFLNRQLPVRVAFIPDRPDFVAADPPVSNYIDRLVFAQLRTLRMNPSPLCDDATFVRRAFLDALGILPTAREARQFVESSAPNKRPELIDRLLSRPEFADHWALKWSDLLRNEEKVLDATGVTAFYGWIRQCMAESMPIDEFIRQLVSARGSTYKNPPANYYRANRTPSVRGETTARLFLGIRLQCAQCHNHPFDRWTQDDYYGWSALFARVDYKIVENKRRDKFDKNEFIGEQIVLVKSEGEVKHPDSGKVVAARLLDGPPLDLPEKADRLLPLAQWLTSAENREFSRTMANLIWYHTMGRGLVEPIDDFRPTNPAANPALLDALADDFVTSRFDLRHLVRRIMNSRAWQLSSQPDATNSDDELNYARAIVKRLTAEQLLDAQSQVLDTPAAFAGYPAGTRAGQLAGVRRTRRRDRDAQEDGDRFLRLFGKPDRLLACECERSNETTLNQAFAFICGDGMHTRIGKSGNRLDRAARSDRSAAELTRDIFWTTLSRPPSAAELTVSVRLLSEGDRFAALQDIAWALMNSKEFVFRH